MKGLKFFLPKCSKQLSIDRIVCIGGTERQEWGTSGPRLKWSLGSGLTYPPCLCASCLVVKSCGGLVRGGRRAAVGIHKKTASPKFHTFAEVSEAT